MRDSGDVSGSSLLSLGAMTIDPATCVATVDGATLPLGAKVVCMLLALLEQRGDVVPKAALLARVWGDAPVDESSLWQNIHVLRRVLSAHAPSTRIETVKGRGYRLILDEVAVVETAAVTVCAAQVPVPRTVRVARRNVPGWAWLFAGAAAAIVAMQVVDREHQAAAMQPRTFVFRTTTDKLPPLPPLEPGQKTLIIVRSGEPGAQ